MKTLILSVDRDDDLGRKTGLRGPVVGRADVLEAANRLALADPEDSDTNCLFAALATLDDLSADAAGTARRYEVAAVTGHKDVGTKSDAILVAQVEEVLETVQPDRLILVSDGAEDENILPLLESRIKIDSVRRVVVKQAKNLEGAYYLVVRMFEDERLQKRFVLPASIAIIVFGLAVAFDRILLATGAALVTLGTFLLIHAMHWEARIARVARDFYAGLKTGKVSFFTSVLALGLIAFGGLQAYTDLHADPDLSVRPVLLAQEDVLLFVLLFLQISLWWVIAGLILNILGRALDELIRYASTKGVYWRLSFGLLALGFILEGLLVGTTRWRIGTPVSEVATQSDVFAPVAIGVFVAFLGNVTYRYVRDALHDEEPEDDEEPTGERIRMRRGRDGKSPRGGHGKHSGEALAGQEP